MLALPSQADLLRSEQQVGDASDVARRPAELTVELLGVDRDVMQACEQAEGWKGARFLLGARAGNDSASLTSPADAFDLLTSTPSLLATLSVRNVGRGAYSES